MQQKSLLHLMENQQRRLLNLSLEAQPVSSEQVALAQEQRTCWEELANAPTDVDEDSPPLVLKRKARSADPRQSLTKANQLEEPALKTRKQNPFKIKQPKAAL